MKGKALFRTSLIILRAARALAIAAMMVVTIATALKTFGYNTIYIDELRGKLKFSIPDVISFSTKSVGIQTTLQLNDAVQLNQVAKIVSDEPKRISRYFETETIVLNPTVVQLSFLIIAYLLKILGFFFIVHFMIKIMKNVMNDELLSLRNSFYLKVIASILVVVPLVCGTLETINMYTTKDFTGITGQVINNFGVHVGNAPDFKPLIFIAVGGFVYLFAKIQEYGLKLKQENDLTV